MVAREGFVYEQKPLSVTRNVVVWEGWSLVRVVVRQGFYCIIIDDKLSWKPHIQSVKSKLSSVLSIMYKASKLINTAGMYTLYCSLFHPYLSYCNEIWGNTYTSNVKCLFTLQKKAIRLICNADRLAQSYQCNVQRYVYIEAFRIC